MNVEVGLAVKFRRSSGDRIEGKVYSFVGNVVFVDCGKKGYCVTINSLIPDEKHRHIFHCKTFKRYK